MYDDDHEGKEFDVSKFVLDLSEQKDENVLFILQTSPFQSYVK